MNYYVMSVLDGNKIMSAVRVTINILSIPIQVVFNVQTIGEQQVISITNANLEALFVDILNLNEINYYIVVDELLTN